jgi:chitinase
VQLSIKPSWVGLGLGSCVGSGGVGGMAHCCKTDYSEVIEWENPKLDTFKNQVKAWMKKLTCPDEEEILLRRGTLVDSIGSNASLSMDLTSRAVKEIDNSNDMTVLLARIIAGTLAKPLLEEMSDIWTGEVRDEYPYIISRFLAPLRKSTPEWEDDDPEIMSRYLICNPNKANARSAAIQGLKSDGSKIIFNCSVSCDANGNCGNELPKALRVRHASGTTWATHLGLHKHHSLHAR